MYKVIEKIYKSFIYINNLNDTFQLDAKEMMNVPLLRLALEENRKNAKTLAVMNSAV